ncbi:alpha/beta hydrolase [Oceanotoga sp. DSM 15011]|uniref:alpha/beta fold hydrolase n=1 Tax=Oceanotoga sp. DSM 15011 TaxID=2984951 RepID=UPI0021F3E41C|nr:alpha/beta hydrolase [Oceanotoga sp. DSM 15011]UYP00543.1 alpha/beta hydrolase [Oceanotoga sp. DSM 15011]
MFLENPGIYYEIDGNKDGTPLIFLNGIMMSTASWNELIPKFDKDLKIIRYDMRDQGKSSKLNNTYDIDIHVEDLKILLDHLQIQKVNILGVSYGSQVAQLFALKYPNRIEKMILPNSTDHVDNYLSSIGNAWKVAASLNDGEKFFDISLPYIYSPKFYNENMEWLMNRKKMFKNSLTKSWFESFTRLASSNETFNIKNKIHLIDHKILLIAGEKDIITPPENIKDMHSKMKNSEYIELKDTGHALFFETMSEFCNLINKFMK